MKTKRIIILYSVPFIMLFFFIRNIALVETKNMDSWMGGGMRMFGRIDKMLYRVSGLTVEYNNKKYFVNLRNFNKLKDEDVESRILPSNERLQELLEELKEYNWCYNAKTDAIVLKTLSSECNSSINTSLIKSLKVYKINYSKEDKKVSLELINEVKSL